MIDIADKSNTLREATASAIVSVSRQETIDAVRNKTVPKGDVFECARVAGLLGIKKTSDVIPDCHPIPVEHAAISCKIEDLKIMISVEVKTIYKTGVEVEAMHGAAITALTIYDMLKPLDKKVEILSIKLEKKKGGKTDLGNGSHENLRCAVIICSDSIATGTQVDSSGEVIIEKLTKLGLRVQHREIIPDEFSVIQQKAIQHSDEGYDLLLFSGGTGLSPRDVTPDALAPLIDRQIPGIMEAARSYGMQRTHFAMLSRGIAGFLKNTLVLTLPGSPQGAAETIDAVFPYVLHVFGVAKGLRHDE